MISRLARAYGRLPEGTSVHFAVWGVFPEVTFKNKRTLRVPSCVAAVDRRWPWRDGDGRMILIPRTERSEHHSARYHSATSNHAIVPPSTTLQHRTDASIPSCVAPDGKRRSDAYGRPQRFVSDSSLKSLPTRKTSSSLLQTLPISPSPPRSVRAVDLPPSLPRSTPPVACRIRSR